MFSFIKAIRDGVIDAIINHEQGYVTTKETLDLYSTREPFDQFHQRIRFCLGVHNQAVKAMRYPPKQYNKDIESAEVRFLLSQISLRLTHSTDHSLV